MIIRKPMPQGKYQNSKDISPIDSSFDINRVCEKFPVVHKTPWLSERLGKAITRRREYLRYRQEHHQKLSSAVDKGNADDQSDAGDHEEQTAPSTKPTTFIPNEEAMVTQSILDMRTGSILDSISEASLTSFATSLSADTSTQRLRVPSPPETDFNGMLLEYRMPFECPYCYTIQDWKQHIFRDLRPYVCTFADCPAPLFSRRHEWFDHEMQVHRRVMHLRTHPSGRIFALNVF